jgi:hypothetical protein
MSDWPDEVPRPPIKARCAPNTAHEDLIERAKRGLRAARDWKQLRQEQDREFIFRELVPQGLVALDALEAELATLRLERDDLRRTLEWICSEHGSVDEGVLAVARAALAGTADGPRDVEATGTPIERSGAAIVDEYADDLRHLADTADGPTA